jgi:phosphatidylglycerophosphatase GEP4|eukprot:m.117249 g.117249  ORF g.117249 m.117249 type:complete len:215 (-) comp21684_c0_seq1:187-831(-)
MGVAQWVNLNGVGLALRLLVRDRRIAVPHLRVTDITQIDWAALRRSGITAVVFDKDNTLTEPYSDDLVPRLEPAVRRCVAEYGERAIIYSNHAGSGDDPDHAAAVALETKTQLPVLRHTSRKPFGIEAVTARFGESTQGVAVVGDRVLTDVAFANLHGMLSIHTLPLAPSKDNAAVRAARWFEETILTRYLAKGVQPPLHPALARYTSVAKGNR